jgi:hypothetical protein
VGASGNLTDLHDKASGGHPPGPLMSHIHFESPTDNRMPMLSEAVSETLRRFSRAMARADGYMCAQRFTMKSRSSNYITTVVALALAIAAMIVV